MKKITIVSAICILMAGNSLAQQYMTRTGFAEFYSKTAMEDVEAKNEQLLAAINIDKKELAFVVLLKGFEFKKELMQTHFNEDYVESDKYPKASFTGTYTSDVDVKNGAVCNVNVKGSFTLHGITKQIELPATLQLINGSIAGNAVFSVTPEDYNITIPMLVRNKIAKQVQVTIKVNCTAKN